MPGKNDPRNGRFGKRSLHPDMLLTHESATQDIGFPTGLTPTTLFLMQTYITGSPEN